ncbi:hypothetical protein LX36DRAFT_64638 [Colletotrichum falcatum]|nr:hypothetical protein LX36DRAFT_64638 [Colletotrichum falcatum]
MTIPNNAYYAVVHTSRGTFQVTLLFLFVLLLHTFYSPFILSHLPCVYNLQKNDNAQVSHPESQS